jgi:ABC-type transport system involved in cytochrome c biogenesis permease subunit
MKNYNVLLMVLVAVALATGTIVEKVGGTDTASEAVYNSWWFVLLLALVGIGAIVAIVRHKMWHTPYRLLIYGSVVVILLGGGLSTWTGNHGDMTLHPSVPCSTFTDDGGTAHQLPFSVTLEHFEVVRYPGSQAPMDFVSHISIAGGRVDISMNNIYRRGGYRFYQADYDAEGGSTLSVSHDPIGITVTYIGYAMLVLGLVAMFLSPRSRFRRLLKGLPLLLMLIVAGAVSAAPQTLPRHTADQMGRVQVLYNGRVCPLQTLAKDFTTKLYGRSTYHGLTPEQVLGGWMLYYGEWCDEPLIKIKGAQVRRQLGMDGRYTSLNNLLAHQALLDSAYTKELAAASEKLQLVQMVANSQLLKIYPLSDSLGNIGWYSQNDPLPLSVDDDQYLFVRKQLGYCQELVIKGDFATLDTVFAKTLQYQQKQAAAIIPSPARIAAERVYNSFTMGRWLAIMTVVLGVVLFALTIATGGRIRLLSRIAAIIVAAVTTYLLLVIVLRWIVGGHVPLAGGFDSMNLVSVVLGIVALFAMCRHRSAPSVALLAMGFCQLVAMMNGSNPPVTHLMPVLNSPLLSLHVTVIMIAYALFLFVMLGSVAALILPEQRERLEHTNLLLLYPAEALLAVGIVIGAVWANVSWGNYWSWDPKEVWALITLIVYLYPIYMSNKDNHSHKVFHIYCMVAILSVAITYFGVNLILGGVHAYN